MSEGSGSKVLIGVLGLALAVALIVIGFLLGRGAPTEQAPVASAPVPVLARPPGPPPPGRAPPPPPGPPPRGAEPAAAPPPSAPAPETPDAPVEEPLDDRCVLLTQYFADLDIATAGVESSSKDAKGQGLAAIQTSLRGDNTNIDEKLRQYSDARRKLNNVRAPTGAEDHLRRTKGVLDEGIKLLKLLKEVTSSTDVSQLAELPKRGRRVMTLSKEVDALGERMRQDCGG
jgi:hypothetical protein